MNGLIADGTFTRAEVVRQFPANMMQRSFLDKRGKLRPFDTLPHDAQLALLGWMNKLGGTNKSYSTKLSRAETHSSPATHRACGDDASPS